MISSNTMHRISNCTSLLHPPWKTSTNQNNCKPSLHASYRYTLAPIKSPSLSLIESSPSQISQSNEITQSNKPVESSHFKFFFFNQFQHLIVSPIISSLSCLVYLSFIRTSRICKVPPRCKCIPFLLIGR